ncbi:MULTISPECIES: tyrosine-type recombinase/integrase [Rothia]
MLGTGCRISEALGLRWQDIDLIAETVTINGAVKTRCACVRSSNGHLV